MKTHSAHTKQKTPIKCIIILSDKNVDLWLQQ